MRDYEEPIYMNNAATSWPKAPGVAEAVSEALRAMPGEANRGGVTDFDVFWEVRKELAELMGVGSPSRIALGCNSTWGLNQAIFGYPLRREIRYFPQMRSIMLFCVRSISWNRGE